MQLQLWSSGKHLGYALSRNLEGNMMPSAFHSAWCPQWVMSSPLHEVFVSNRNVLCPSHLYCALQDSGCWKQWFHSGIQPRAECASTEVWRQQKVMPKARVTRKHWQELLLSASSRGRLHRRHTEYAPLLLAIHSLVDDYHPYIYSLSDDN